MPTAEINVPTNANVKMTPKLRKKFSCSVSDRFGDLRAHLFKLVARVQDDGRQEEVEEDGVFERLRVSEP